MKRILLTSLLVILAAGPVLAGNISLYPSFGVSTPMKSEDFQDYWKPGGNVGFGFGVKLSRLTELVFDLNYCKHELDNEELMKDAGLGSLGLTTSGGDATLGSVLMNARILFTGSDAKVKGYFIGGLGVGFATIGDYTVSNGTLTLTLPSQSDSGIALRLGLGLDFRLGKTTWLFVESNGVGVAGDEDNGNDGGITVNLFKIGMKFSPGK